MQSFMSSYLFYPHASTIQIKREHFQLWDTKGFRMHSPTKPAPLAEGSDQVTPATIHELSLFGTSGTWNYIVHTAEYSSRSIIF